MFVNTLYCLFLTILLPFDFIAGKKKAADHYFNICHRSDPDVNNCIEKAISDAMPQFTKGIPDLKLLSIDPMFITMLQMKQGDRSFKFELTMLNVTMTGLQRSKTDNFRINFKNESDITMKFAVKAPWMSFKGKYKMGGNILVIPVEGNGDVYFNFTNTVAVANIKSHVAKNPEDQKNYLSIDSFLWELSTTGGKAHFTNLFNGDKRLGATINNFFNSNFLEIFASLKHLPEQALGSVFKEYSSILFKNYPFEELLPR